MSLVRERPARILGYVAFGAVSLIASLYLTFPSQAIAQRIGYEVQRSSGGSMSATVGRASLSFPVGVVARDVRLQVPRSGEDDVQVTLDRARGSIDLLPLFGLSVKPRVEVQLGEGELEAAFQRGDEATSVDIDVDAWNILKPPVLPGLAGVPFGGVVDGGGSITIAAKPADSSGELMFEVGGLSVGPGPIAGFTLPEAINLGAVQFSLVAENGKLVIKDFSQEGGQVNLELSGELRLNRQFARSNLDGCVKFKFSDTEFLSRFPKVETAVQLAGARFQKDSEEFLNVPLRGLLMRATGGTGVNAGRGLCRRQDASGRSAPGRRPGRERAR